MGNPRFRTEKIVVQETAKETLIYDTELNKAFCLNEMSTMVWKLCDGTRSITEIAAQMSESSAKPISEDLVWLAIDQLHQENLLTDDAEELPQFSGLSRREVIRKVGFGAMVALPMVSSILAPSAVSAQSCFANGVNVGATVACGAGPPCSCNSVIGGPGATACCTGVAVPGACLPIPNTTAQQCECVCGT